MPHLVPVWFWWDGQTVLVFSTQPNAVKVRASCGRIRGR